MAKSQNKDTSDTETVVNYASPGSVVGIQCGSLSDTTVVVDGAVVSGAGASGRWIDFDDIDPSRNSNPDD